MTGLLHHHATTGPTGRADGSRRTMAMAGRALPVAAMLMVLSGCKPTQPDPVGPEQCVVNRRVHGEDRAPIDMGDGLISTEATYLSFPGPSGAMSVANTTVKDCRSGRTLLLKRRTHNAPRKIDFDHSAKVDALLTSSQGRGVAAARLAYLAAEARRQGIEAYADEPSDANRESCGCSVFYPELRGDKQSYAERMQ